MEIKELKEMFNNIEDNNKISSEDQILIIKNYKEMCKILKENEKTGDSKKAQQKEWKRYFDFSKEGQKYLIYEIYEKPLPKNMYINPIDILNELLICERIIEHMENPKYKDKRYVVSMTGLAYDLGYINDIFKQGYEHPNQLIDEIFEKPKITESIEKRGKQLSKYDIGNKYKLRQLQENVVYDCYNIIPRRYKDRITKTLKRLEQEFVINVSIINFGTFIEPNKNEPIIEYKTDEYGDKHVEYRYKTTEDFRELTDEEDNLVQTIKNELLKKYECENIHDLYKKKKIDKFNNELQKELLQCGIASVKKCYVLAFAKDYIYEKRDNIKEKQRELNELFLDKSLRNSYNMKEKRINEKINEWRVIEGDEKKIRKYYTKEQEERDKVLKYILSI